MPVKPYNKTETIRKGLPCRMEEKKWSVYFQNPEYLEMTRMFMIPKDMIPLVRRWCGLKDGMRVLDVGAGTGYFTRLLASGPERVTVTGLDRDDVFVEYARRKAGALGLPVDFVPGDALALPFADNSFDLVASHTFLTSVPDPVKAMSEMRRVLRPGGTVASVTPMSFDNFAWDPGRYPEDCEWAKTYESLHEQLYEACFALDPFESRTAGVDPALVPRLFADSGLRRICIYPLAKAISLSDAALSPEEKLRYVDLYERAEEKHLEAFMALPEMAEHFTRHQADEFLRLLREKCAWHRAHLNENTVWDWVGSACLLVTGVWEET